MSETGYLWAVGIVTGGLCFIIGCICECVARCEEAHAGSKDEDDETPEGA